MELNKQDNKTEQDEIFCWLDINLDEDEKEYSDEVQEEIQISEEAKPDSDRKNIGREILSYCIILVAAVVAAVLINRFVIINAHIPSSSMVPTLNVDDRLLGFKLAYVFTEPERDDIIIFEHQCYENKDKEILIKRVIGIPGDLIEIKEGVLYRNGYPVEESYLKEPMRGSYGPYQVPEDCYFVMGDNRNISDDARFWSNMFVTKDEILAKAWLKYRPSVELIK